MLLFFLAQKLFIVNHVINFLNNSENYGRNKEKKDKDVRALGIS